MKLFRGMPYCSVLTCGYDLSKILSYAQNNKNQIDNKLLNTNFNLYLSQIQVDSSFLKHPLQKLKNVPTIIHLNNFKYQTADKKLKFDFKHFYLNAEKKIVLLDEFLYYTSKADNTGDK